MMVKYSSDLFGKCGMCLSYSPVSYTLWEQAGTQGRRELEWREYFKTCSDS